MKFITGVIKSRILDYRLNTLSELKRGVGVSGGILSSRVDSSNNNLAEERFKSGKEIGSGSCERNADSFLSK